MKSIVFMISLTMISYVCDTKKNSQDNKAVQSTLGIGGVVLFVIAIIVFCFVEKLNIVEFESFDSGRTIQTAVQIQPKNTANILPEIKQMTSLQQKSVVIDKNDMNQNELITDIKNTDHQNMKHEQEVKKQDD